MKFAPIALLGFLVFPLGAEILSDNLAKTSAGTESAAGTAMLAASFGTGSTGYTLNSVSLLMRNSSAGSATVSLYSDAGLKPGSLIATLTPPASYPATLAETTFTSSAALSANTTYWIVLRADSGQFDWSWSTNSNGDGAGYQYSWGATSDSGASWYTYAIYPLQMRVNATAAGSCTYTLGLTSVSVGGAATGGSVLVTSNTGCAWTATSNTSWITISSGTPGNGTGTLTFSVAANPTSAQRTGTLTIAGQTLTVIQAPAILECSLSVTPAAANFSASAGSGTLAVASGPGCSWGASTAASWITLTSGGSGSGAGSITYNVQANPAATPRSATIEVAGSGTLQLVSITQAAASTVSAALRFVPVTPCRVMDTRTGEGKTGSFGPPILAPGATRDVPVPQSGCGIPATARAYSVNVTVVPAEPLAFLTLYPTGAARPLVSTLNAFEGQIIANAAIVPAGTNGSISVYVTNNTHVIVDINGYFTESTGTETLLFYPLTPCRVTDTRTGGGKSGAFGPPALAAAETRSYPIPSSGCGAPSTARAFSLNFTVVPPAALGYITAWPSGQARPLVSTLNSLQGRILANAAIVPAGSGGSVDVFTTNATDLVIDINGYFAPPASGGLSLYTVNPCRVADTRSGQGFAGAFGPPAMTASESRTIPVPSSVCGVPSASAYSLNVTVVPPAPLAFLTLWPAGSLMPVVSTLNAFQGQVAANAALVPAAAGSINVFTSNASEVILDINGYFAP